MKLDQQQEGFNLPEGPVRWSWIACLAVTLNSVATIADEVSEYFIDLTNLLIKDFEARREDEVRLGIETLDDEN